MVMGQNPVPPVNIKIAGKWMFIHPNIVPLVLTHGHIYIYIYIYILFIRKVGNQPIVGLDTIHLCTLQDPFCPSGTPKNVPKTIRGLEKDHEGEKKDL